MLLKTLIDKVVLLAEQFPDAFYVQMNGCFYEKGKVTCGPKNKDCIIGQAFHLAFPESKLKLDNLIDAEEESTNAINVLSKIEFEDMDLDKIDWLRKVQSSQDNGFGWNTCVKLAGPVPNGN